MVKSPPPPTKDRLAHYAYLLDEAGVLGIERRELPPRSGPNRVDRYIDSLERAIRRRLESMSPADVVTVEVLKSHEYQNFLDACNARCLRFYTLMDARNCLGAAARRFHDEFELAALDPLAFAVLTSKIEAGELTW